MQIRLSLVLNFNSFLIITSLQIHIVHVLFPPRNAIILSSFEDHILFDHQMVMIRG